VAAEHARALVRHDLLAVPGCRASTRDLQRPEVGPSNIYSRFNPSWIISPVEDSALAVDFIAEAIDRNGAAPHTVHVDRGTSMTSKPVSALLADLGVTHSHSSRSSRPHSGPTYAQPPPSQTASNTGHVRNRDGAECHFHFRPIFHLRDTPRRAEFQNLPLRYGMLIIMTAAGSIHRSTERSVNVAFRLSPDDRAELRRRASLEGLSVQAYLERVALGRPDVTDLPPGPKQHPQEELPMTG